MPPAMIAAAKKNGALNTITLPRDWANYGEIMDAFQSRYGIKITDAILTAVRPRLPRLRTWSSGRYRRLLADTGAKAG